MMVAGTWTYLPNAAWANAFRVGYSSNKQRYIGGDVLSTVSAESLGLPTGVTTNLDTNGGYPQSVSLRGFTALGSRNTEIEGPETSLEFNDTVNYLVGDHSLRFGGTIMNQNQNGGTWANTKGVFTFGRSPNPGQSNAGLVGFLVGQNPYPGTVDGVDFRSSSTGLDNSTLFYGNPESHIRRAAFSLFAQDDWRILPRLTLNLGVRYELSTVIRDRDSILASFNPSLGIVQEGAQIARVYNPDHNNFAPRVGLAWDVRGNGKTVIRAGGSIVYELVILRTFTEIGNDFGLAGNPSAWVNGCTVTPYGDQGGPFDFNLAPGDSDNCTGTIGGTRTAGIFTTSGGTRDVGGVEWSRGDGTIGVLNWEATGGSSTIFPNPTTAVRNCSTDVAIRDNPTSTIGRLGGRCPIVSVDPNLRTPYVEQWSLSIQHAITNNIVLDVAYVGNHGTKFISRTDDNQAPAGSGWTQAFVDACDPDPLVTDPEDVGNICSGNDGGQDDLELASRPYMKKFPYIDSITRVANRHTSNYNGLQMSLTARNFHGLSMVSGYTFSHALDVASSNGSDTGTDSYNVSLDYGRAGSDLRQRFTFSPTYAIPGRMGYGGLLNGWKVNGNFKYQTGRPWAADTSGDFMGSGRDTRWDFAGDASDFVTDYQGQNIATFHPGTLDSDGNPFVGQENPQTGLPYVAGDLAINTSLCTANARSATKTLPVFGCWTQGNSAITPPPPNSFGNMTRGLFSGPSFWNLDMSVSKVQRITERVSADFRVEVFNIFNHPVFAQPENSLDCNSGGCELGQTFATPDVDSTNPVLGSGGQRRLQLGVKLNF
jgi:hypothetical protein